MVNEKLIKVLTVKDLLEDTEKGYALYNTLIDFDSNESSYIMMVGDNVETCKAFIVSLYSQKQLANISLWDYSEDNVSEFCHDYIAYDDADMMVESEFEDTNDLKIEDDDQMIIIHIGEKRSREIINRVVETIKICRQNNISCIVSAVNIEDSYGLHAIYEVVDQSYTHQLRQIFNTLALTIEKRKYRKHSVTWDTLKKLTVIIE